MFKVFTGIFAAMIALSVNGAAGKADEVKFERTEVTSPLKIGKRHRVVKDTMIYARIQPYDLYNNYLHRWIDRPLFLNREWRESPDGTQDGFMRDIQLVKEYEIDGFTILGNAYQNRYQNYLRIVDKGQPKNFSFMPGLAWGKVSYERYLSNAKLGLKSAYAPRINGKVPFFSYGSMPLPEIKKIREKLAADGCGDVLLFDDISVNPWGDYQQSGKLSAKTVAGIKKQFQESLDTVDGLIFCNYHMYRNPLGDYTLSKRFALDLDANHLSPVLEEIYGEKRNQEKLLGFNVRHGYIGHMSGTNEGEYGTEQLRQAMDTALVFNPDIISLVEWNEANENTSFQPTVYNGKSLQRIIRFYSRKLKGLPATPNPGDNLKVPNLIVSSRQVLALGEKYRIELLNVPDSDQDKSYSVQLTLKNQDGGIIRSFPADIFKVNALTAITYTLPTEALAGVCAVIPELAVTAAGQEKIQITDLQYTRIVPSVCWNFKEVRQPLRDLLSPEKVSFAVTGRAADGSFQLSGSILTAEPLASVEVLDREAEVFAVDRNNEFGLDRNYLLLVSFSTKEQLMRDVKIQVPGVNDFIFKPWSYPYAGFGNWTKNGDTISGNLQFFGHGVKMLLAIPRSADAAVIKFDIQGLGKFELPVKEVIAKGVAGIELPGLTVFQIERMNKLADHPVFLKQNRADFKATVKSDFTLPCFQLRAITESGRIYRSKPVFPAPLSGKMANLNVFSSSAGKAVVAPVPAEEIVDINYAFTPEHGTILRDPANPYFDAQLGGGFKYLDPMRIGKLSGNIQKTAPQWVKSGDGWALKFDGVGNYLVFPIETIPHGSFTLEFECKTDSAANQALFRHYSYRPGSLLLYIIDGKLQAEFASMGRNYLEKSNKLPVNLPFQTGRWVKVKVIYDMHKITFTVDGKSVSIPFNLRAAKPTSASFGGFTLDDKDLTGKNLKFFQGELRSFRIRHNAEF